jgi:hypothetical protein
LSLGGCLRLSEESSTPSQTGRRSQTTARSPSTSPPTESRTARPTDSPAELTETESETAATDATEPGEDTPSEQQSATIYVSPDGDDGNSGTENSPMKTIQTVLSVVEPGQTIYLQPGQYPGPVSTVNSGEPDNPITITGSRDAVIRPSAEVDEKYWNPVVIQHSHYRLTGVTIDGLHTPDAPEQPSSYVARLLKVSPEFETSEYVEDVVIAPHGIGNSRSQLINVIRAKNCEFGPFRVIGPAGVDYLHGDKKSHQGEILYIGSPLQTYADGADGYPWDRYDKTRNIHVHHIDNSDGYHHSEIVDCKDGTENVTIEYCTDAGGSRNNEPFSVQSIHMRGHECTVRWNRLVSGAGNGIEVYKPGSDELFPAFGFDQEVVDRIATENEIYGNEIYDFGKRAIALDEETRDAQRHVCGNDVRGETNGTPEEQCPDGLPDGEGVGHTGGESPWSRQTVPLVDLTREW